MRKVYQVVMSYYDGDHDHGRYESPLFTTKEAAQRFRDSLLSVSEDDPRYWWTDVGWKDGGPEASVIREMTVCEDWDGGLLPADEYLRITWT